MLKNKVQPIEIWNRQKQCLEQEQVFGQKAVLFLYQTKIGRFLEWLLFSRKLISQAMGVYQSSRLSRRAIMPFVKKYHIPLVEFEDKKFYASFNDFFIRQFKPSARLFCQKEQFPAFAEGRYFGFQTMPQAVAIKGGTIDLKTLFGQWKAYADSFKGGPGFIARLCPVDYHRFHAPDDAMVLGIFEEPGVLHSVNPWALMPQTFCANARQFIFLQTKHFGKMVMILVGALGVGKIILLVKKGQMVQRGEGLGFFLFGGSTVLMLGELNAFQVDKDVIAQTLQKTESFVQLGAQVAQKIIN